MPRSLIPRRRTARLNRPSLLAQVLAVNAALVSTIVLGATLMIDWRGHAGESRFLLLVAATLATVVVNGFVLRRRFAPIERLIAVMERVDALEPGSAARRALPAGETTEVARLHAAFERMLDRLDLARAQTATAVLAAQERERARIARDLHDEANQALTGVLLRLEASIQRAPEDLREELRGTQAAATQAIEELLRLARELRPTVLDDLGLNAALRTKIGDFSRQTGVPAELQVDAASLDALGPEQQTVVYRVVQESLSNVAQHAGAARVQVELQGGPDGLVASIRDDGCGFDGAPAGGHGLIGMRERAGLAGGSLAVRSRPGIGTTVELRLREDRP